MNLISPQWMLCAGIFLSFLPFCEKFKLPAKNISSKLLQLSVVLLGASLNFHAVIRQGISGLSITFFSLLIVFVLGAIGRKLLAIEKTQGLLLTMGTAICGGSAIGALAPVIRADNIAFTISIAIVFLLNAIAAFAFPWIGHLLQLSQDQFGLWAALAIHDTSSVVAAAGAYGARALEVATTIKLTRALWIIPITLFFGFRYKSDSKNLTFPWFILGFIVVSLIFTFADVPKEIKINITHLAKIGFAVTLFLIGLTFDLRKIKQVGMRPLIFGVSLWLIVSTLSLWFIIY